MVTLSSSEYNTFGLSFSLIAFTTSYNTPEEFLKQMIQSVRKQTYGKWELCIANANPANETVAEILRISSTKDERIKVKDVPENVPTDPWLPCLHPNTIPSVCHFH